MSQSRNYAAEWHRKEYGERAAEIVRRFYDEFDCHRISFCRGNLHKLFFPEEYADSDELDDLIEEYYDEMNPDDKWTEEVHFGDPPE